DCCLAVSCGLGVDLPTARNVDVTMANTEEVTVDNHAVILSPFLGMLYTPCCSNYFVESYAQFSLPVNTNPLHAVDLTTAATFDERLHDFSFFHFDIAVGTWLYRNNCMCCNCCGGLHSIAAVAEAHYTTKIGGSDNFDDVVNGLVTVDTTGHVDLL